MLSGFLHGRVVSVPLIGRHCHFVRNVWQQRSWGPGNASFSLVNGTAFNHDRAARFVVADSAPPRDSVIHHSVPTTITFGVEVVQVGVDTKSTLG